MAKTIDTGIPKMRIEQAKHKKNEARIDNGKDTIVGVNTKSNGKYDPELEILEVDNDSKVGTSQMTIQYIKSKK